MTSARPAGPRRATPQRRALTRRLDRATGGGVVTRTTLPGGLRIVTEAMSGVRSASVGVWVPVGSRDESVSLAGSSHFLEHLLFKATDTRTALDIASAMDTVGGEFNAFTEKEHTCYYATVLDRDVDVAIDIVCDVVLNATIAAQDVDVERGVVLEEISMRDDDPSDLVHDEFASALFGDTPLGRPILGSEESISRLTRRQVHGYYRRRYTTDSHGRLGRGQHRPRRRRAAGAGRVRRPPRPGARRPGAPCVGRDDPAGARARRPRRRRRHRTGQPAARRVRAVPPRRAALGAGRAVVGPRRRDELAAVPAHPRGARAGLLGVLVHQRLRRRRAVRRLRRLPARQGRRGAVADAGRARRRRRRRAHGRRDRARQGPDARQHRARPRGRRARG